MDIAYFPNAMAQNALPVMAAMISALESRGHKMVANALSADAALIWSMLWAGRMSSNQQVWEHYQSRQRDVLIMEVGCLRRGELWKIGINGMLPRHCLCQAGPGNRPEMLGLKLYPWRQCRGSKIYVCLQRTQSWQWRNMPPIETWLQDTVDRIRQHSDRTIVIRPHPRQRLKSIPAGCELEMPRSLVTTYDDFDFGDVLDRAWAVMNFSSHPGPQAVINGVPAFVGDQSLAAPVANLDLARMENPVMPDRTAWFDDLTWTEFSVDEISQGLPLERLLFT
jgi:hypothetical protein